MTIFYIDFTNINVKSLLYCFEDFYQQKDQYKGMQIKLNYWMTYFFLFIDDTGYGGYLAGFSLIDFVGGRGGFLLYHRLSKILF